MKLKRSLGFWSAYATSMGMVVSGTAMVAVGNGFGTGGFAFAVPAAVALLVIIMISLSYGELASMMPGGGMIGEYTLPALGRLMAIIAVLAGYLVLVAADGGTQLIIAGDALNQLLGLPAVLFSWTILALLVIVNITGVQVFAKLQIVVSLSMMGVLGGLGVLGVLGLGTGETVENPVLGTDWTTLAQMGAVAIWLFIGMEFVAPMAEEIKNPWRNVPLGMLFGVFTIFLVDTLFGGGLIRYVGLDELAASATPQVLAGEAMFGSAGLLVMTGATVLASFSTGNAELSAVPRMLYGLANQGLLPKAFAKLHPVTRVPVVGVLFTAALMALVLAYASFTNTGIDLILKLISVACVTWLVSYIIAQVDVIVLRCRYPQAQRPFKTPLYPVPQVLGILACIYIIIFISPDPQDRLVILSAAGGLLALITLFGVFWLRRNRLPIFSPLPLDRVDDAIKDRSEPLHETPVGTAKTTVRTR